MTIFIQVKCHLSIIHYSGMSAKESEMHSIERCNKSNPAKMY